MVVSISTTKIRRKIRKIRYKSKAEDSEVMIWVEHSIALLGTECKLNAHKTFRRRPGRILNALCTFNLHSVSAGVWVEDSMNDDYDKEMLNENTNNFQGQKSLTYNFSTLHKVATEEDVKSSPWSLKLRNANPLICGQININSIRNKFEPLLFYISLVSNNIDVLLISETKIDNTFPVSQFCVPGYSVPFRLELTGSGRGIMLYVKGYVPCRMLSKFTSEKEIEAFAIEINLLKVKWLLVCSYNLNFCNLPVHLNAIDKAIEFYSKTYDKI